MWFFLIAQCVEVSAIIYSSLSWEFDNGVLIIKKDEITPNSSGNYGWDKYAGETVSIEMYNGITEIGRNAFYNFDRITSINIPNSVVKIDVNAFAGCEKLSSIDFSNNLKIIDDSAFSGCTSLANINIPSSVNEIGLDAFKDTPWFENQSDGYVYAGKVLYTYKGDFPENENVVLKNDTKGIADRALSYKEISSIILPESLEYIGDYSLAGLNVESNVIYLI